MNNNLENIKIIRTFIGWIGGICKPSEKGVLTTFPPFVNLSAKSKLKSQLMLKFEDLPKINSERWLSLEDLEGERWCDVDGLEDYLQISCYGRLKRKHAIVKRSKGRGLYTIKEKVVSVFPNSKGYVFKAISICGKGYNLNIHRLVAKAFVPNKNNYPDVNHKDENTSNNIYTNLEWCTRKYNSNYGTIKERTKETKIERNQTRKITLYTYEGEVVKDYNTLNDAERDTKVDSVLISRCCRGLTCSANGLHFRYKGEAYKKRPIKSNRYTCRTQTADGKEIVLNNVFLFCKEIGISYNSIMSCIKGRNKRMTPAYDNVIEVTDSYGRNMRIIDGVLTK